MKKVVNSNQKAASYCCESSNTVDIARVESQLSKRTIVEGGEAASYCCESSNTIDIAKVEND